MATTSRYWADRFTAMDDRMYKQSEAYIKDVQKQFGKAQTQIQKDLAYWYQKLADNNEISYDEARKLLSADELADFHMTVAEYIAHGRARGLDSTWEKQMVNASSKVHISRLQEIQTELSNTIHNLYADYEKGLTGYLSELVPDTYYRTAFEIAKGTGIATTLHALDSAAVSKMLTTPWCTDKKAFSERIWSRRDDLINTVNTQLTQMLITGKAPDEMIKKLAHDFNVEKSAAGRLVMTESAAMANESRRQCMKDLDVEEFEFVATLDSHTSELCRGMDGEHFPMSQFKIGVNAPPLHCNCRSCTVPYFNDEFTEGETRAAREPGDEGYNRITNKRYRDWAKEVESKYSAVYEADKSWEYKDWYKAVVKDKCKNLLPMNLQLFANDTPFIFGCNDITAEWFSNATPNSHKVIDAETVTVNGIKYDVDGDDVYLDYEPQEKHIAEVIESKLGGKMQMNPKFRGKYQNIQCGDFTFRDELWDLKTMDTKPGNDIIYNSIHKKKRQALNFIVDISNNPISVEQALNDVERLFKRRGTYFVKKVMIMDHDEIIKIFERK